MLGRLDRKRGLPDAPASALPFRRSYRLGVAGNARGCAKGGVISATRANAQSPSSTRTARAHPPSRCGRAAISRRHPGRSGERKSPTMRFRRPHERSAYAAWDPTPAVSRAIAAAGWAFRAIIRTRRSEGTNRSSAEHRSAEGPDRLVGATLRRQTAPARRSPHHPFPPCQAFRAA